MGYPWNSMKLSAVSKQKIRFGTNMRRVKSRVSLLTLHYLTRTPSLDRPLVGQVLTDPI